MDRVQDAEEPENPTVTAPDGTPTADGALRHELLVAQDTIAGLKAELATAHARMGEVENTEVGIAYARIDALEDLREAAVHEMQWAVKRERELEKRHAQAVRSAQEEVALVKSSATYRLGNLVILPISKLTGRGRL